ncbi:MAG: pitrilysin family protein [Alphaproteobacteria bacterium]
MLLLYPLFTVIFFLCAAPQSYAKEADSKLKALNPTTKVQDLTSPKGQRIWIVEHHQAKVVSLMLMFRDAGSKSDPLNKEGRAKIAAALFDEGAGEYDAQHLKNKFLEQKVQWNVSCNEDVLEVFLRFPAENLKAVVGLLKLVLAKPHYQQDALDRNRNEMLTDISQSLHTESVAAKIALNELIYDPTHPYTRTPKQTLKALPGITIDDIKSYRTERLGRDHLEVVAVGSLKPQEFLVSLDDMVADLPSKATPLTIEEAGFKHLGEKKIVTTDIPQSFIYYLQPGIPYVDPDFIPATLMARILGSGAWESRLWNEIREKRGLAYSVDLVLQNTDHSHLLLGQASSKNETAMQVIELIRTAWQEIFDHGITQKELDLAKDYALGDFVLHFDSTAAICRALAHYQHINLPPTYVNERNALFAKVTLEDMNRVTKRLIKPQDLTFVCVGSPQQSSSAPKKDQAA